MSQRIRDREAERQRKKFIFTSPDEIDGLSLDDCLSITRKIIDLASSLYPTTVRKFCLFSGGNDSTVLFFVTKDLVDDIVHINTGIGIEETRQFVRDICQQYGKNLIERCPPPGSTYEELIVDIGFPGPNMHYLMYNRLKQRALRQIQKEYVLRPRTNVVQFFSGVRYSESSRRFKTTDDVMKDGSAVWVAPLAHWSNENMDKYRHLHNIPINPVSANLHISGECLCGCFARQDELEQIRFFYPETARYIEQLQEKVKCAGRKQSTWGDGVRKSKKYIRESGILCSSCDSAFAEKENEE